MPPFTTSTGSGDELRVTDVEEGETEEAVGGEDGLGVVTTGGWDEEALGETDTDEPVEEIEDWD